jgi:tetratricopeptide (TPR) repeat protein
MEKAVNLDPLSPVMNQFLAQFYAAAGDYERALRQYHYVIEMDPNYGQNRLELAGPLAGLGKYEESIAQFEKGQILVGINPAKAVRDADALRHAFQTSGAKGYWKRSISRWHCGASTNQWVRKYRYRHGLRLAGK